MPSLDYFLFQRVFGKEKRNFYGDEYHEEAGDGAEKADWVRGESVAVLVECHYPIDGTLKGVVACPFDEVGNVEDVAAVQENVMHQIGVEYDGVIHVGCHNVNLQSWQAII